MESFYVSLYYWDENYFDEDKKNIQNYLKFIKTKDQEFFVENRVIYNNSNFEDSKHHIYFTRDRSGNNLEKALNYFLSEDRDFLPISIHCDKEVDYDLIGKILKNNYGENVWLERSLISMLGLYNERKIVQSKK